MPWGTIAVLVGALVLIGGVIWLTYRLAYQRGAVEVKWELAQGEVERREKDAVIAAAPAGKRPLDELFK